MMRKCEDCNHYRICREWYGHEDDMPNYAEDIECKHYDSFIENSLSKKEQSNAEVVKQMPLDVLNAFLWWFKIDAVSSFMQHGGEKIMNAEDQKVWLQGNDRTYIAKLFRMGQEEEDEDSQNEEPN